MDPESNLDAVRNIGILNGRIAAISDAPLRGKQEAMATGLVVAPGFIDIHAHGQDNKSLLLKARDGVCTALDLEEGAFPVGEWYASRAGKAIINYGISVGHIPARIKLKNGLDVGHRPTGPLALQSEKLNEWKYEKVSAEEMDRLLALLKKGLDDGALAVGLGIQYTPGATREEIYRIFQLAAERKCVIAVHVRSMGEIEPGSSMESMQEVIADAATSGASLHIVHITSSGLRKTPVILDMIAGARRRGLDITAESYPYTAASTYISSALLDLGWQERLGITYKDLQWAATGERLTEETFTKYRKQNGFVIMHMIPEQICDLAISNPALILGSDGVPFTTGGEHPRGAGSFARILGRYVRKKKSLTLMDALGKMTLMPARRLESYVPQMKNKGRLKIGADADITIFDPMRILDRATFEKPMQPSEGIVDVLIAGVFVVRDSTPVESVFPGRAIKRQPGSTN